MTRPALRAAAALLSPVLLLSTLPAFAAVQPVAVQTPPPAARAKPVVKPTPPAIVAATAAAREITAGQASMPYLQWLATLPGFRFSPATSAMLVKQFGTDRLFTVTRTALPVGGATYTLAVPTLRRANPDGSSFAWSAMQGQMTVQPDGLSVVNTFSAPRIVAEDNTVRAELRDIAFSSVTVPGANGVSFGTGTGKVGAMEMTGKADQPGMRMDGLYVNYGVTDQGATVDLFNDMGIHTLAVQGERIDDLHMAVRFNGIDKTALETLGKLGKDLPADDGTKTSAAQRQAMMAPLARQLGMAVVARGATIDLEDISFSYRGSKARVHGQLHLENATPADLDQPASLVKKVAGHLDVQVPLAMLHAFADNAARTQLAKQQPGSDAAAIAKLGATIYDGMLRTATASGYLRVEGDMLVTTVDIRDGVILLNGKPLAFPKPAAPVAALDSGAGGGRLMRARRIADKCTLPDYPPDVVAQDRALALAMQLTVNADGSIGKLRLSRSSGLPAYDKAVLAAAANCTYIPALRDGQPIAVPSTWEVVRAPGSVRP